MAYKFKVGDKASFMGKEGTVVKVDKGHSLTYKVAWSSAREDYSWFRGSDLDKVDKTKLVVGQKYTPVDKTVDGYGTLAQSVSWKIAQEQKQNYLFYKGLINGHHVFAESKRDGGDYFNPEDVIPYVEEDKSDVIFTTKDGVDIRNGDKVYWVFKIKDEVILSSDNWNTDRHGVRADLTYFSSEKLAIEFKEKLENKTTTKTEKTMTIQEQIIKELGLQVGDTVKITHKVPNVNLGWLGGWVSDMDAAIGKEGIVRNINPNNVTIKVEGILTYAYPAQVLEFVRRGPNYKEMKISKDYTAKVYKDRIEVGDQTITIEDFRKLEKLVNKVG
jgi:hypothetical protein